VNGFTRKVPSACFSLFWTIFAYPHRGTGA
jgi:hypothetical protein